MANTEAKSGVRKKKVLIMTDYALTASGFGRANRLVLDALYKTQKYELANLAVGTVDANMVNEVSRTPWKTYPAVNLAQLKAIKEQNDKSTWEGIDRMAGYGAYTVDQVVKDFRPDVGIFCQDIWGVDFCVDKPWFNKITSALWVTLDSLPLMPSTIATVRKTKNFWSWADFATNELHRLKLDHAKTLHGPLDSTQFHRLSDAKRLEIRRRFGLSDEFIIGFVFRNQLRKSIPNLLEGFKKFKDANPKSKAKLALLTNWTEGWNIPDLIKEYGVSNEDVLTVYVCRNCKEYIVKPFSGPALECPYCRAIGQMVTVHPSFGISVEQLNEFYSLLDTVCHCSTSSGQEIPLQESLLCELTLSTTNYAAGEDMCQPGSPVFPLGYFKYKEIGSNFTKSCTRIDDITRTLQKIYEMPEEKRRDLGRAGRKWVIDHYDIHVIQKSLEEFIDQAPFVIGSNSNFVPSNEADDSLWLPETFKGFMGKDATFEELEQLKNIQ